MRGPGGREGADPCRGCLRAVLGARLGPATWSRGGPCPSSPKPSRTARGRARAPGRLWGGAAAHPSRAEWRPTARSRVAQGNIPGYGGAREKGSPRSPRGRRTGGGGAGERVGSRDCPGWRNGGTGGRRLLTWQVLSSTCYVSGCVGSIYKVVRGLVKGARDALKSSIPLTISFLTDALIGSLIERREHRLGPKASGEAGLCLPARAPRPSSPEQGPRAPRAGAGTRTQEPHACGGFLPAS